jgi:perosamine synthetase
MTSPSLSADQAILGAVHSVLGATETLIPLHEPEFSGDERSRVLDCIDSTFVSSVGKYVDQFEADLATYTGAKHAVAVVNGTAALHVSLVLAGVRPGDEVLVPALSFVATANAVAHCGAHPHFVDSERCTLGMDPVALETQLSRVAEPVAGALRNRVTGRRIAAITPMHTFGHPADMAALLEVASRWALPLVEDAAESLGSTLHGRHMGVFGRLGALSFNGNKIITTGGGGAILTDDPELACRAKHLTTTAKRPHRWEFFHDEVAWNYRMPNLNAALGCAQLDRLPGILRRKRTLAERYAQAFRDCPGVQFVAEPLGAASNYWLNTIVLAKADAARRDHVLGLLNDAGYQCRPAWQLLNRLPMYASCPQAELPVAEALAASLINLPSSARLAGLAAG